MSNYVWNHIRFALWLLLLLSISAESVLGLTFILGSGSVGLETVVTPLTIGAMLATFAMVFSLDKMITIIQSNRRDDVN